MPRARSYGFFLLLAGLVACGASDDHNVPEQESEETGEAYPATLQDSLVTGEAIQTGPPPVEGREPTAIATGDTVQGLPGDTAGRP